MMAEIVRSLVRLKILKRGSTNSQETKTRRCSNTTKCALLGFMDCLAYNCFSQPSLIQVNHVYEPNQVSKSFFVDGNRVALKNFNCPNYNSHKTYREPLHIMGMQSIWKTKQKNFFLLGIEIYSHVQKTYCSVLQIGCIAMDVQSHNKYGMLVFLFRYFW